MDKIISTTATSTASTASTTASTATMRRDTGHGYITSTTGAERMQDAGQGHQQHEQHKGTVNGAKNQAGPLSQTEGAGSKNRRAVGVICLTLFLWNAGKKSWQESGVLKK